MANDCLKLSFRSVMINFYKVSCRVLDQGAVQRKILVLEISCTGRNSTRSFLIKQFLLRDKSLDTFSLVSSSRISNLTLDILTLSENERYSGKSKESRLSTFSDSRNSTKAVSQAQSSSSIIVTISSFFLNIHVIIKMIQVRVEEAVAFEYFKIE